MPRHIPLAFILGTCLLSGPLAANDAPDLSLPHWSDKQSMEAYRVQLYRTHVSCQEGALQHALSPDEAGLCSTVFLALKLSFLNGASLVRYATLSAPTRAMANEKGYAAYRAWLHRHLARAAPYGE